MLPYGDMSARERRLLLGSNLPLRRTLEEVEILQRQVEDQFCRRRHFHQLQRQRDAVERAERALQEQREVERQRMAANDRSA